MTSKSLQVILIVILSVLAYSCGKDNPVGPHNNQDSLKIISISPKFIQPNKEVLIKYQSMNKIEKVLFGEFSQSIVSMNDSIIKIIPNLYVNPLDSFKIKLINKKGYAESQFVHFFSTKFDTNNTSSDLDVYSTFFQPIDGYSVTEGDEILLKCSNLYANTPNSVIVLMNNIRAKVNSIFVKDISNPNYSWKFNFISVIVPKLDPGAIIIDLTDYVSTKSNSRLIYSDKSKLLKNLSININNIYYKGKYYFQSSDKDQTPKLIDTIQPIALDYILNEQNISIANVSNEGNELIYNKSLKDYRNDNYVNSTTEDKLQVKIQLTENDNLISSIFLSRNYKSNYQMTGNGGLGNEEINRTIRLKNVECTFNSTNKTYKVFIKGENVKNVLSAITNNSSKYDKKLFWSQTIKTSYIGMLSSQPPEATIEISFELY